MRQQQLRGREESKKERKTKKGSMKDTYAMTILQARFYLNPQSKAGCNEPAWLSVLAQGLDPA